MFNSKMLRTAGVLFVTFQEEIAPSSKTNQGENSYKKKMFFGKYKKEMIDGYCEKYRYTNPQSFI